MHRMLERRSDFSLVALSGKLYAIGGEKDKDKYSNSVEMYDPIENKWRYKSSMYRKRCAHAAFAFNGRIFVVGGIPEPLETEIYDPTTDKWTLVISFSICRKCCLYFHVLSFFLIFLDYGIYHTAIWI